MSKPTTPAIDRTIYPMPMFATFRVADIAAAEVFYQAVGFVSLATIPGPDGCPVLVHLRRMKYQDLLLVPGEPDPGSTTVSFAAGGQDLVELATILRAAPQMGARIEGPTNTPWFTTDLTIDDPDGNRVILTAPREAEMGRAKEWARENITGDFVVEK
jgi:predicted lactoylglutathione lyase